MPGFNELLSRIKRRISRERIFVGSPKMQRHISTVLKERKKRADVAWKTVTLTTGAFGAFGIAEVYGKAGLSVTEALKVYFKEIGIGLAVGAAFGRGSFLQPIDSSNHTINDRIRRATNRVGKQLSIEAKRNERLMHFLLTHKYVYVDKNGRITGTNQRRFLGVGYLRLSSKKILTGKN